MFVAMAAKVGALVGPRPAGHAHNASLEELKQCPECQKQDKARAAAWDNPPPLEEMVKEIGIGLEWLANAKAAMLPAIDALKNALESGDLPQPPEHMLMRTHKSQKEMWACDICNVWLKRQDAIFKGALPPPHNLHGI
jgi:hypothetical protein